MANYKCAFINYNDVNSIGWNVDGVHTVDPLYSMTDYQQYKQYSAIRNLSQIRIFVELLSSSHGNITSISMVDGSNTQNALATLYINSQDTTASSAYAYCTSTISQTQVWIASDEQYISVVVSLNEFKRNKLDIGAQKNLYLRIVSADSSEEIIPLYKNRNGYDITYNSSGDHKYTVNARFDVTLQGEAPKIPYRDSDIKVKSYAVLYSFDVDTTNAKTVYNTGDLLDTSGVSVKNKYTLQVANAFVIGDTVSSFDCSVDNDDMITPTRESIFDTDEGRVVSVIKNSEVIGAYTIEIKPNWAIEALQIRAVPKKYVAKNEYITIKNCTTTDFDLVSSYTDAGGNIIELERIKYSEHTDIISFYLTKSSTYYSELKNNNNLINSSVVASLSQSFGETIPASNPVAILDIEYEKPVSLEVTVSQGNKTYYYNKKVEDNTWDIYGDITITEAKLLCNSGNYETIDASDVRIKNAQSNRYVEQFEDGGSLIFEYEDEGSSFETSYELQNVVDDIISSIVITNNPSVTFGHKLNKDNFELQVNYQSLITRQLNSDEYEFVNANNYITSSISSLSVYLINGEFPTTENVSVSNTLNIVYSNPAVESVTTNKIIKGTYLIEECFDLTDVIFTVHYEDTEYTKTFDFNSFKANIDNSIDALDNPLNDNYYDGNQAAHNFLQLGIRDIMRANVSNPLSQLDGVITISLSEVFVANDNVVTATKEIPFKILDLKSIKGIEIVSAYTTYTIGDVFPKEEDTTTIKIYYEDNIDGSTSLGTATFKLNSQLSLLVIEPFEEQLNNIDYQKTIIVKSSLDSTVSASYTITVTTKYFDDDKRPIICSAHYEETLTAYGQTFVSSNGAGFLVLTGKVGQQPNVVVGYIDNIFEESENARLVLFKDYKPKVDGMSNIEITFPCFIKGSADDIDKCHFGILFGANNAVNRLFVSGNPDEPNADWHTAEINTTDLEGEAININGNFSYISDESIMYYGETDNDVVGYEIVSNDKLLVLKTKSDKEKTIYFRNPTVVQAIDTSGNSVTGISGETLYQEEFSLTKGNNSNAGISPKTIVNFNGDTLFIDANNQLVGLDLTGIVGDNQRYANSRSKYIDKMLRDAKKEDFSVWTNNKYLFLAVKDVGVFVTHYETYHSELRQYEWWFMSSENPTTFIEIDDVIYFANDKGELYKFNEGQYQDIHKVFSNYAMNVQPQGSIAIASSDMAKLGSEWADEAHTKLKYKIRVIVDDESDYANKLYYRLGFISNNSNDNPDFLIINENNDYYLENISGKTFPDNNEIYLNTIETSNTTDLFVLGQKYTLKQITNDDSLDEEEVLSNEKYELHKINSDGTTTKISLGLLSSASICDCINDDDQYIGYFDTNNSSFFIVIDGEKKAIVIYGKQATENPQMSFRCEIKEFDNVSAYYVTAPFTMGNINYFKTMWSYTLTNDTDLKSEIEIAYTSNKIPYVDTQEMSRIEMSKDSIGVYLTDFDYKKVDFDKKVVPRTYTTYRTLPYQKFICFAFKNDNNTNAVLSAMSVVYTLAHPSYGGD